MLKYLIPGEDAVCKFCSGSIEDAGDIFPPGRNITRGGGGMKEFFFNTKSNLKKLIG